VTRPHLSLLFVLLAGCKSDPAAQTVPTTSAAASATTAPSSPEPAKSAAPAAGGLGVVAKGTSEIRLVAAGDRAYLLAGGVLFHIDEKGLHQDPAQHRGFPASTFSKGSGVDLVGTFPDALWAQVWHHEGGDEGGVIPETLRWSTDRWSQVRPLEQGEYVIGVASLGKGRAVGLAATLRGSLRLIRGNDRSNVPSQPTPLEDPAAAASASAAVAVSAAPAASAAPAVSAAPRASSAPAASAPLRPSRVRNRPYITKQVTDRGGLLKAPRPIWGLPTGHLFVIGFEGESSSKAVLVERWSPSGKSTVDALPAAPMDPIDNLGIVARSGDDAYAYAASSQPYLVHLEGGAWKAEKTPGEQQIHAMHVDDEGTYYLATRGGLFRKAKGESAWSPVSLPANEGVIAVATPGGKLWALVFQGNGTSLVGPGATATPIQLPGDDDTQLVIDVAPGTEGQTPVPIVRYPATEACERPYITLRSHVSPTAKEFPDVVEILAKTGSLEGVELVVEQSPQWTYLGAKVPSLAVGRTLVDAMNRADRKLQAALYCQDPRAVLKIALH
jgi:hypothetical protein